MTPTTPFGIYGARPILCVNNCETSIDYYLNRLGFSLGWAWSNERQLFLEKGDYKGAGFALVGFESVHLMLSEGSQGQPGSWIHIDVDKKTLVDKLHEYWTGKGAIIVEPPSLRPWGMYEMRISDLDGNVFRVSAHPD